MQQNRTSNGQEIDFQSQRTNGAYQSNSGKPKDIKLFAIASVSNGFNFKAEVELHFYRTGRTVPIGPYELLVQGYEHLNDRDKRIVKRVVDELFTQDEAEEFSQFMLDAFGFRVVIKEVELPIASRHQPWSDTHLDDYEGQFHVPTHEHLHRLSFSVSGFFKDCCGNPKSRFLDAFSEGAAVDYMRAIFQKLQLNCPTDEDMAFAVNEVFEDLGLIVSVARGHSYNVYNQDLVEWRYWWMGRYRDQRGNSPQLNEDWSPFREYVDREAAMLFMDEEEKRYNLFQSDSPPDPTVK